MPSLLNRSGIFYVQTCVGGKIRRQSLRTRNQQVAKEKFRRPN
jgi:hypothetical protein